MFVLKGSHTTELVLVDGQGAFNKKLLGEIFADAFGSSWIAEFVRVCWQKSDTRNMLIFLTINLMFMFVELSYGIYSNSLGLISDAFHMLSDCLSLLVALYAAFIGMSFKADKQYTYGYGRAEVLSGLFNGVFLIFVAFNVFIESIERIYEP